MLLDRLEGLLVWLEMLAERPRGLLGDPMDMAVWLLRASDPWVLRDVPDKPPAADCCDEVPIRGHAAAGLGSKPVPGCTVGCSRGGQGISDAGEKHVGAAGHAAVGVGAAEEGRLVA